MSKVKVLVVDDSAFMRKVISDLLAGDPDLEVLDTARDGLEALDKLKSKPVDVVTLDVEMPRMDGLTFLQQVMRESPLPVIMLSSQTQENASTTIQALSLGAVDFVAKPSGPISIDLYKVAEELRRKVKMAADVDVTRLQKQQATGRRPGAAPAPAPASKDYAGKVVIIGTSTGGPAALHEVLPQLPAGIRAGILVVQHMPAGFTRSLAQRLNDISSIEVKEGEPGDPILEGRALIAPGGHHMVVTGSRCIDLNQEPPRHGVRPAVDVTMESAVPVYGTALVGVVLTGMGYDGAKGMHLIKRAGGRTVAEDASTCVVYGMPRVVVEMGCADRVVPLPQVARSVLELLEAGGRETWKARSTRSSDKKSKPLPGST